MRLKFKYKLALVYVILTPLNIWLKAYYKIIYYELYLTD